VSEPEKELVDSASNETGSQEGSPMDKETNLLAYENPPLNLEELGIVTELIPLRH